MIEESAKLQAQLDELKKSDSLSAEGLLERAEMVAGVRAVIAETPGANPNLMRQWIDQLRKQSSPIAVLLASVQGDKVVLVAGISRELVDRGGSAGKWVGDVAKIVGGGGGGKPDLAQAGGKQPEKLPEAFKRAKTSLAEILSN